MHVLLVFLLFLLFVNVHQAWRTQRLIERKHVLDKSAVLALQRRLEAVELHLHGPPHEGPFRRAG